MRYLQQSVHVRLHVRDGHPLHDDVSDPSLQRQPFGPGCPTEVDASHAHWGTPEENDYKRCLTHTLNWTYTPEQTETRCCTWLHWTAMLRRDASFPGRLCVMAPAEIQVSSPSCSPSLTQASPAGEEPSPDTVHERQRHFTY